MAAIILYLSGQLEKVLGLDLLDPSILSTTAYSFSCSETLFSIESFQIREEMSRNSDSTNFDESTAMLLVLKIKEKDTKK